MRETILKGSRIVVTTTVGAALVVLGIILTPLPGPGLLIILAGIAVLSREYRWARRLRDRLKARVMELKRIAMAKRETRRRGRVQPLDRPVDDIASPERHDIPA